MQDHVFEITMYRCRDEHAVITITAPNEDFAIDAAFQRRNDEDIQWELGEPDTRNVHIDRVERLGVAEKPHERR